MNKIKIGYFADGPWSHRAFEKLIENEYIDIAFIVPRTDTKDDTLENYCSTYNIDYLKGTQVNSDDFFEKAKQYNCDLFVSMSFNQIFRTRIINLPRYSTINCHAGKLPFYRGRNILNWALINNEDHYGITVHYVDEGIDTGDIILQKVYPISEQDDYSTLLERSYKYCAEILTEAVQKFITTPNNIPRIKQKDIHPVGMYCGVRGIGDEIIDWNNNSIDLFNFIRSICKPGPQATTFVNGKKVSINKSRMITEAPIYKGTNGQIIGKTEEGFMVKTKDTFIEILDITTEDGFKLKIGNKLRNER